MTFAWALLATAAVVTLYWFGLRPWLRSQPALAGVWVVVDKAEAALWARSRTILAARLMWIPGALVGLHDAVAALGVDWAPFTTQVLQLVPEAYRPLLPPLCAILVGLLFEHLRKLTTKPLEQKGPA